MMKGKIRGFVLKFNTQGGIIFPTDPHLHRLAVEFSEKSLTEPINFSDYETVLVAAEVDDAGKPTKVTAMNCRIGMWVYPVWRFTDEESGRVLIERTRNLLDDQAMRGKEVLVHIADHEAKESRCPRWRKFLRDVAATKASLWRVKA